MDHLACMTTFVAVVEKGGFASAARHLSVSPATVTQQVQTLENRIGVRLLQRTTRKCMLTEAGQEFYERGIRILEDIREADAVASAVHATLRGTIRINISPTLAKEVSTLVARYAALHPEPSFDLTTTSQMGDIVGGRIDLAIRDDSVAQPSLIVRRLACTEWTACASPGHVARNGLPIHPAELAQHNCLIYVHSHDPDEWRFADGNGTKSVRVSGSLRSSDPHVLRAAAISDMGLILLPDAMVANDLLAGRLVRVLNGYSAEQPTIRAVYPSRRHLPLKVRSFLDFAAMAFGAVARVELDAESEPSAPAGVRARSGEPLNEKPMAEHTDDGQSAYAPAGPRAFVENLGAAKPRTWSDALSATAA
jgi:DNA-binding transcriptional LysR family regulator